MTALVVTYSVNSDCFVFLFFWTKWYVRFLTFYKTYIYQTHIHTL